MGWEDPLKEGMAILCSILAWRIPLTKEPGRLLSTGSKSARHDWSDFKHTTQRSKGPAQSNTMGHNGVEWRTLSEVSGLAFKSIFLPQTIWSERTSPISSSPQLPTTTILLSASVSLIILDALVVSSRSHTKARLLRRLLWSANLHRLPFW